MKIKELYTKQDLIRKMYEAVTDFDRVLELLPVIDEIEKHIKAVDKAKAPLMEKAKDDPEQAEKEWNELLEKEIKLTLPKISKAEAKKCGFNPFEYRLIQNHVD